jgi:hypothetical protein
MTTQSNIDSQTAIKYFPGLTPLSIKGLPAMTKVCVLFDS